MTMATMTSQWDAPVATEVQWCISDRDQPKIARATNLRMENRIFLLLTCGKLVLKHFGNTHRSRQNAKNFSLQSKLTSDAHWRTEWHSRAQKEGKGWDSQPQPIRQEVGPALQTHSKSKDSFCASKTMKIKMLQEKTPLTKTTEFFFFFSFSALYFFHIFCTFF